MRFLNLLFWEGWSSKSLGIRIGPEECLDYSSEYESAKSANGVEKEGDTWEKTVWEVVHKGETAGNAEWLRVAHT